MEHTSTDFIIKNVLALLIFLCAFSVSNAQTTLDATSVQMRDTTAVIEMLDTTAVKQIPETIAAKDNQRDTVGILTMPNDRSSFKPFKFKEKTGCIYHLKPAIDFPVTGAGILASGLGYYLIGKKPNSDSATIANLNPETDIIPMNRNTIHNYNPYADHISDYFLHIGFVFGFAVLLDHDVRQDALKISLLYLETMAITGTSYEMTAALVDKYRPYAYNTDSIIDENGEKVPEVSLGRKTSHNALNSFYGGHPSVPAASAFFVASVYSSYHPHSPFRFALYGLAAGATGTCAYLRWKAGDHFPTDLAIGVTLGTAYGILIPQLHRCKNDGSGLSFSPFTGHGQGLTCTYTF